MAEFYALAKQLESESRLEPEYASERRPRADVELREASKTTCASESPRTAELPRLSGSTLPTREQLFSLVYRQMRSLTAGEWDPDFDDLVQLAAEQTLKSLPSFEGRSQLSTWTFGICYRIWSRNKRSFKRWLRRFSFTRDGELPEHMDQRPHSMHLIEREERAARLRLALGRLSPKRRTVVVLHDLEEMSVDEIVQIVGAKTNTVRSRLRDGRRDLAALLKSDDYFGDRACSVEEFA